MATITACDPASADAPEAAAVEPGGGADADDAPGSDAKKKPKGKDKHDDDHGDDDHGDDDHGDDDHGDDDDGDDDDDDKSKCCFALCENTGAYFQIGYGKPSCKADAAAFCALYHSYDPTVGSLISSAWLVCG